MSLVGAGAAGAAGAAFSNTEPKNLLLPVRAGLVEKSPNVTITLGYNAQRWFIHISCLAKWHKIYLDATSCQ